MEQIKINVPDGYELKQEGNTYTVVEKEYILELGKDYVNKYHNRHIVIERAGDYDNRGFIYEVFLNDLSCSDPENWRLATEKEVRKAFEEECVRRYGEGWKEVKIKKCMFHGFGRDDLNKGEYFSWIRKTKDGWRVWNRNGCLYSDGKWAEKLEEPKFAECLEDIDRPWYLDTFGEVEGLFEKGGQDKNHLPTKELTEGLLALTQLLSFRHDVWEKEGKPEGNEGWYGIILTVSEGRLKVSLLGEIKTEFRFKKEETAEWFLETHKELLTEYFNKIVKQ